MGLRGLNAQAELAAFEALCLHIEAPLYSYALKLLGNPSEAEDIAQEALTRLFHSMRTGKLKQSPRSYVFSIAHNLCMDRHRSQHRSLLIQDDRIVQLRPQQSVASSQSAERALLRAELEKALGDLPQDQRAALLLREFGEMSYNEIADILGSNLAQVKIWIFRARKHLAVLLDRDGQYIGKSHHGN